MAVLVQSNGLIDSWWVLCDVPIYDGVEVEFVGLAESLFITELSQFFSVCFLLIDVAIWCSKGSWQSVCVSIYCAWV